MTKFKINSDLLIGSSSEIDAVFLPVNIQANHSSNNGVSYKDGSSSSEGSYRDGASDGSYLQLHQEGMEQQQPLLRDGGMSVVTLDVELNSKWGQEEVSGPSSVLMHAITTKTPDSSDRCYRATLTSMAVIIIIIVLLVFGHGYIHSLLVWMEEEGPVVSVSMLMALFVVISFPVAWGLQLLMLTAGYLYGLLYGPLVVTMCVSVGLLVSTPVMRIMCSEYLRSRFYSRKVEAIVNVVSGPHGMRVIALTRLTPIPFGLQNALFSLSSISLFRYLVSSVGGLVPMTVLNCYMGSTLKNMEDLMSDDSNRLTGFFIFGGQILMTVILLWFVVRRARLELKKTMDESDRLCSVTTNGDCLRTSYVDNL